MKLTKLALILFLICGLANEALAQESEERGPGTGEAGSPIMLEPVVVTAGRIEEKARNVTRAMTIIPQEEIKKNQYQDLGELLRNYGLQIDSYTPNSALAQISIRGIRTSLAGNDLQGSILLLIDGRRMGTDNVSLVPLVNVERIEILRGPAAVQYGASAVGGVVNIISKRGQEEFSAQAEAGGGSWNSFRTQGGLAGMIGPVDFSGGVSYLTMRDYSTAKGKYYRNTDLPNKVAYSANLSFNFLDEHRLGAKIMGIVYDDQGSPGYIDNINRTGFTDRGNYSLDFSYAGGYEDFGLSWMARYFLGHTHYLNDDPADDSGWSYYKSNTDYQGIQGQLSFNRSFISLTGGLDWLKYDTKTYADYFPRREKSDYNNLGLFLLGKLLFFDERLILSGGIRYDAFTLKIPGKSGHFDHTTPSFGAAWHITDWLTLRGNYGTSYRIPSTQELLGFNTGFTNFIGNRDLKPEKGYGWDSGFEIKYEALKLGLTYFYTDYTDKIITRSVSGGDAQYYNLPGTINYQGLEGQASFDIGKAMDWSFVLRPYINFTQMLRYADRKGHKVRNVSDLDMAWGLNFQHPEFGLDVDLRFIYYGHQKIEDFNSGVAWPNPNPLVLIGGKLSADLFVRKTIYEWAGVGAFSIKGEIRNIFNQNIQTIKDYPQPGTSFFVGLRYDY